MSYTALHSYENSSYTENPPLDIQMVSKFRLDVKVFTVLPYGWKLGHALVSKERRVRGGASQLISCGWSANVNLAPDLTTYYQDFSENLWSLANLI